MAVMSTTSVISASSPYPYSSRVSINAAATSPTFAWSIAILASSVSYPPNNLRQKALLALGNKHFINFPVGNRYESSFLIKDVPEVVDVAQQITFDVGACSDLHCWQWRCTCNSRHR